MPYPEDAEALMDEIRDAVEPRWTRAAEEEIREIDLLQQILHDDLAAVRLRAAARRPMVLPVVVEV